MTTSLGPEPSDLRDAAESMAGYLVRATADDGRFTYRINLDPEVQVAPRYNEVRHAGTIYAMVTAHERQPSPERLGAILRSADYLRRAFIAPVGGQGRMLCAWSRPELTGLPGPVEAKLGGTGLAIVALACVERVASGATPLADLRSLAEFLVWMQQADGSFYSKYRPTLDGRSDSFLSLYYPGEAALGLVMLDEIDPDRRWRSAAGRGLAALARRRAGQDRVEPDHWALIATNRLLRSPSPGRSESSRELLVGHARQIAASMLDERSDHPAESPLHGSFTGDGRTTPTATRLEGLLAAMPILERSDADLVARADEATAAGTAFLLRSRVPNGNLEGGVPRAIRRLPPAHPDASVDFNLRASEVRIDYVQHALSAVLGWEARVADHGAARGTDGADG